MMREEIDNYLSSSFYHRYRCCIKRVIFYLISSFLFNGRGLILNWFIIKIRDLEIKNLGSICNSWSLLCLLGLEIFHLSLIILWKVRGFGWNSLILLKRSHLFPAIYHLDLKLSSNVLDFSLFISLFSSMNIVWSMLLWSIPLEVKKKSSSSSFWDVQWKYYV